MSVRVIARVRPLSKTELNKDVVLHTSSVNDEIHPAIVRIPNPRNENETYSFQFNNVYGPDATQQDLFDGEVAPTIKHLFNGLDVTIFAYGVTGTGKTHTMRGGKSLAERGVIPRLLSGIYRRGRKVEKDSGEALGVQVSMSYYEIYNDKVFDLFEAPEKRTLAGLPLRDVSGKTVIAGLTERPCESLKEFEKLYDQANINRSTGATKLNAHSSRSHAVLCVKVSTTTTDGRTRTSTVSAIDLAGSEDNRRTDNSKERLVESSSINKSLFVLAQCVEAISKKATRIPYRESKMTRILSLGQNNGITIMILNLASVRSYHLDILSSLNFANRTKKIEVRESENEPIFMGCSRPVATIAGTERQPLRQLGSAIHNSTVRKAVDANVKAASKPKLFAVYSDNTLTSIKTPKQVPEKTTAALKRPSEAFASEIRPPKKIARPSIPAPTPTEHTFSEEAIEDMVARKVNEILASRGVHEHTTNTQSHDTDDLERRIALLERRIDEQDDEQRAEGLSLLLTAKQHHAQGDLQSSLRSYELARPLLPGNTKLEASIARVKAKLHGKTDMTPLIAPTSLSFPDLHVTQLSTRPVHEDLEFVPELDGTLHVETAPKPHRTRLRQSVRPTSIWRDSVALAVPGPEDADREEGKMQQQQHSHAAVVLQS